MDFNATITTPRRLPSADADTDRIMDALINYHPALSPSRFEPNAWDATITFPAEDLKQALGTAQIIGESIGGTLALAVTTTAAWDRAYIEQPDGSRTEFISVQAAATRLGITPQAVRARIAAGRLAGHKVGRAWFVPARAVRPR